MLVPVKWIRDYVNIDMDTVEFADKMTMTGTKVETSRIFRRRNKQCCSR